MEKFQELNNGKSNINIFFCSENCADSVRPLRSRHLFVAQRVQHHFRLLHSIRKCRLHRLIVALERENPDDRRRGWSSSTKSNPYGTRTTGHGCGYIRRVGPGRFRFLLYVITRLFCDILLLIHVGQLFSVHRWTSSRTHDFRWSFEVAGSTERIFIPWKYRDVTRGCHRGELWTWSHSCVHH